MSSPCRLLPRQQIIKYELLREVHADAIEIFEDSMLVINQLGGNYEC